MVRWVVGIVLVSVAVVAAGVVALVLLTGGASEVDVDVDATVEAQAAAALDDQAAIQATIEAGIQATVEAGASPPPIPTPAIESSVDQAPEPPPKTPQEYRNLTSMLDGLVQDAEDGSADAEEVEARAPVSYEGTVAVTVYARDSVDEVERFLNDADVAVRNRGRTYLEAFVPVGLLGPLSELDGVIRVEPVVEPRVNQAVGSGVGGEGAALHGAPAWHDMGYDGSGVRVGVIDAGFGKFVESRQKGEVPDLGGVKCYYTLPVLGVEWESDDLDDCGEDTHGTRVAETIVDVAPGADLYVANTFMPGDLRDAVEWMIDQGVTVINFSMSWPWDGPGDGTSPSEDNPLHAVDMAVEAGITWVNSAGNHNRSSWIGGYSDSDGDGLIEFDESDEQMNFLSPPENAIQLRWDDDWGGADTDLDIFVYDSKGELIASSRDDQTGEDGHIPYEMILHDGFVKDASYKISVQHVGGPPPSWIQLLLYDDAKFEYRIGGGITNPESANEGMLAVGAAWHWTPESIEHFSSRGPTPDGRVEVKPDIVGADAVKTSLGTFMGTSQAAPHVAGLAALVRQRYPNLNPAGVAQYLKDHALPRPETPGGAAVPNNTWGYGLAHLPGPEAAAAAPTPTPEPAAGPTPAPGRPGWAI